MLLCHRGCGLEATFTNKNGQHCCYKSAPKCPIVKSKIGSATSANLKGKTYEEIHGVNADSMRKKRTEGLTGRILHETSIEEIKQSNIAHWAVTERTPWNKGKLGVQIPWNKGKTGYSMPSRRVVSEEDYQNYQKYKRAVYNASKKTYKLYETLLNPMQLKLGRCGDEDAHQIDHCIPVSKGYEFKIPVKVMADIENLQLLPWKENLTKSNKTDDTKILNMIKVLLSKYGL